MYGNTGRAAGIQSTVRAYAHKNASSLTTVPVESKPVADAIRILQVQIFTLTDAVADLAEAVEKLSRIR